MLLSLFLRIKYFIKVVIQETMIKKIKAEDQEIR